MPYTYTIDEKLGATSTLAPAGARDAPNPFTESDPYTLAPGPNNAAYGLVDRRYDAVDAYCLGQLSPGLYWISSVVSVWDPGRAYITDSGSEAPTAIHTTVMDMDRGITIHSGFSTDSEFSLDGDATVWIYLDLGNQASKFPAQYRVEFTVLRSDSGNVAAPDSLRLGGNANDSFESRAINETIDGGLGVDSVCYSANRSDFRLASTDYGYCVSPIGEPEPVDSLQNIERLHFSDFSVALDLGATQASGQALLLLGAVLGYDLLLPNKALLGQAIALFDSGLYSMQTLSGALMRLDIWGVLANGGNGSATNIQIAEYLLTTVHHAVPDAESLALALSALDAETGAAQGDFLWHLAESQANQAQLELLGLAATGLPYIG